MPIAMSRLNTISSMKFRATGKWSTGAPSGSVAWNAATFP